MKRVIQILLIFICFLLQCTLFQNIAFAGIVPNLMIIVTSIYGFVEGRSDGMIAGFICGLLTDIFYSDIIGLNTLVFLYIGYVNGIANRVFYPDDIKFPILFISLSDLSYLFMIYLLQFLLRARFDIGYYFMHVILPEAAYTIVVAVIVYLPLQRIIYRLGVFEREGE